MDYPALFQAEAEALLASAAKDLDAPVPACPGWDCRRLVSHVARLLDSTVAHLPRGVVDPPPRVERPPAESAALVEHYRRAVAATAALLRDLDPAAPAWNMTLEPRVVGFWRRRLAHELQIHAWDAAGAAGEARPLDPVLAADGIDELLRALLPASRAAGLSGPGDGTAHIHLTDTPGEWMIGLAGDKVDVTEGHAKGDAGLRGEAGPALLALWGRTGFDAPGLTAFGDTDLLLALRAG
ncbi:maleylpyruvate isomerase family mycothiol-dependent enzyme [Frankia sp. CNm7]|uniref:Maleylpyruvate isomerase family mycothiol-dependent enzyme n=1 Tax=Frankia nepalensis TaxID=1836974 RepID=A0A937RN26_9ACTN|nr:maleylpyruvate isomerase family mycothiol-dependent enzyme [Frankia nepalensis]MBL7500595.1 maleylpyruvate isomerase family mycothiol-dependent enzyme [Frankia nepalensis]MBL7511004.1 maleylpyruvate isomerase family mycothiol-dependent enzyme [Frankia nepalensis]MBL7520816.1 maleylpyruvate isomerase family mycothiol-dependent enzyme [Frankia nepalensis]MBL7630309.1 maleylpyruvate isomerase family mycothiol-dependent enzyme [Frankia nepalensis]